ncbi:MAG TPA: endonuclease/exonuclease/phosphatase family protein [Burkholderiales bacterium]|nr:endonuclease/exonuclease/phosphatase family protein [Burkholderiales bacterium]
MNAFANGFSVASYNIHQCVGTDFRRDPARVAEVIRELECDVVGLQEVDSRDGPHMHSMQLDYLASETGMQGIAGATILRHEGHYGNAVLTSLPVLDVRRHDFSFLRREPRGALDVDLDLRGRVVRVLVTHLGLNPKERRFQVKKLLHLVAQSDRERLVIVLGDINEWLPISRPLRWLHGLLGKPPWQRTFPVWCPVFALDRVWVKPMSAIVRVGAHRSEVSRKASDHFPIKAYLSIERRHREGAV